MEAPNPYLYRPYCEARMRPAPSGQTPVYFSGVLSTCDLCGYPLECTEFFADAEIPGLTQWGYLCPGCIVSHQVNFGWGIGQLYQQVSINPSQWLLVAGYPDESLTDNT